MEAAQALFVSIGLDPKTAANVSSNAKVSSALRDVIAEAGLLGGCDKAIGNLLYATATKARPACSRSRMCAACAAAGRVRRSASALREGLGYRR
jgi:hypothetical protein